ncbi:MAG: T9SS type A sorting domain-containing protein, partial [candidate division Zixibacteria bacterium]|nr:T9SS type A sorting domain-containing protein [candidate division Zixibacteria bacterium]
YLLIEPKRIRLVTNSPVGVDTSVAVSNAGVGIINWTAVVSAPWLQADVLEAVGAATVGLTIDTTGLLPGEYSADIVFTDSGSFNVTDTLEFVLEYWEASDDTVVVGSETIGYSQSGTVPIEFRLTQAITGAQVPLAYDPDVIHMDSVVLGADAPGFLAASCVVDSGRGLIRISLAAGESDSSVSIGLSELVVLHVSARGAPGFTTLAMPVGDSVAATVTAPSGDKYFTTVLAGDVLVDNTTDIADHGPDLLPEHLELSQNHPNPFNAGTLIRFSLPAVSEITLRLYNVLGQNVRTLTSGTRSAGEHAVFWDGLTSSGRPAASGIYFYRLETSLGSRVRKMVLLK